MPEPKPSARDEVAVRAFIENFSAMMADHGLPRMAARVLMTEMVAEEDSLTAADLAQRLGAGPAAISNALKYLTFVGLFVRESVPNSRRDRYRLTDESWFAVSILESALTKRLSDAADRGIAPVGGPDTNAGQRLAEMRDFYRFLSDEMSGILDRWFESRQDPPVPAPSAS